MKKNTPMVAGLVFGLLVVVFLFAITFIPGKALLSPDIKLFLYTVNNETTGQLSATIPFTEATEGTYTLDIALDTSMDGKIDVSESQISGSGAYISHTLKNNYWLVDNAKKLKVGDEVLFKVTLTKVDAPSETIEKKVRVEAFEIGQKFGFDLAEGSEDIKRGGGFPSGIVSTVYAEGDEVFRTANTPDLAQDRMECAAVSAANSLMSLAGEHDKLDHLPEFTGELIEELKTDVKFNNGITLENMVAGKNEFTKRHNLPITTELKFAPTKDDIIKAINSGGAVELSFAFVRSASGRKNTGHVVTLMGASKSQIFVHDSGTPEGLDPLRMFGTVQTGKNTFINVPYPLWDGVAYIDGIVIQNWTDPERAQESYIDGQQASEIEVLVIGGRYYPTTFFRSVDPDKCTGAHYHAVSPDDIVWGFKDKTSFEVVSLKDPLRGACGFGKVSEVPVEKMTITFEQSQEMIKHMPN